MASEEEPSPRTRAAREFNDPVISAAVVRNGKRVREHLFKSDLRTQRRQVHGRKSMVHAMEKGMLHRETTRVPGPFARIPGNRTGELPFRPKDFVLSKRWRWQQLQGWFPALAVPGSRRWEPQHHFERRGHSRVQVICSFQPLLYFRINLTCCRNPHPVRNPVLLRQPARPNPSLRQFPFVVRHWCFASNHSRRDLSSFGPSFFAMAIHSSTDLPAFSFNSPTQFTTIATPGCRSYFVWLVAVPAFARSPPLGRRLAGPYFCRLPRRETTCNLAHLLKPVLLQQARRDR